MNRHKFPCGCVFSDGHESFGGQLSFCPRHAAAPDLLAVCEFVLRGTMKMGSDWGDEASCRLMAEIKKAKGGA